MLFTKSTEKKYMVGFDIRDDYCQISYCRMDENAVVGLEPVTFSPGPGQEMNIPTLLCKKTDMNQWFCGREARESADAGEGMPVDRLLSRALEGKSVVIGEEEYDPCGLLALFVKRCFTMLSAKVPTEQIYAVMFTARQMTKEMADVIAGLQARMELPVEHVYCENYANSFYNYMLMQKPSLREGQVLLCEYDGEGEQQGSLTGSENAELVELENRKKSDKKREDPPLMRTHRLIYNQKTSPVVAFMEDKDYVFGRTFPEQPDAGEGVETVPPKPLQPAEKDALFLTILEEVIGKTRTCAVYLIGDGFKQEWMKRSLTYLCYHRRAFQGNNLYSKGAALGALIRKQPPAAAGEYFFLGKNKLRFNIGMQALRRGQGLYHAILDAGENWYEVDKTEDYILESGNEFRLLIMPVTGEKPLERIVTLEDLPVRQERTTRLRVCYTMSAPALLQVHVTDLGFGEISPASGQHWDKELSLEENGQEESQEKRSLGRVLLTVGQLAKQPYYMTRIGRNLYSAEELCYSLVQSAQFLDAWLLDPVLIDWLEDGCGLQELAESLRPYLKKPEAVSEFVTALFNYVGYVPREKQRQTRQIVQAGEGLEEWESRLARADYLRESGRFAKAGEEYRRILNHLPVTERTLRSGAQRGLGMTACSRFLFSLAAEHFHSAWKLSEDPKDYLWYLAAVRMGMSTEDYISFVASHPEAYACSMELEKKMDALEKSYPSSEGRKQLLQLRQYKEDGRSYSYEAEMLSVIENLKKRYRQEQSME